MKTQNFKVGKQTLLSKIRPYYVKSQGYFSKNTPFFMVSLVRENLWNAWEKTPFQWNREGRYVHNQSNNDTTCASSTYTDQYLGPLSTPQSHNVQLQPFLSADSKAYGLCCMDSISWWASSTLHGPTRSLLGLYFSFITLLTRQRLLTVSYGTI